MKQYGKPLDDTRLKHMIGVAEYMYKKAPSYNLDPEEMYLLGLLHEIGYIQGHEDNYTEYSDKLFEKIGLISKKGKAFRVACKMNNQVPNFTMDWGKKSYRMRYLLYEADMHITSSGKLVDYDKRLQDIYEGYSDNGVFERCQEIIKWLELNKKED